MKKNLSFIIALSLIGCLLSPMSQAAETVNIYVSHLGAEGADGTFENPLGSLEEAMILARQYSGKNIDILFMGGRYEIDRTVSFSVSDSAAEGRRITYKPYNGEKVIFTGAKKLSAQDFEIVDTPAMLKRIPYNARGKVLKLDLSEYGLDYTDVGTKRPQLYIDNKLQTTARYPNGGLLIADTANRTSSFLFDEYDVSAWSSAEDAIISGSLLSKYFWRNFEMTVSGNRITAKGTVRNGAEFYVENLIEELDCPGEYYVDKKKNMLYYYPSDGFSENSNVEITSFFDTALRIDSGKGIKFKDLKFDKFGGNVFYASGVKDIEISGCTFDFIQGGNAVYLKGSDSLIDDNSFYGCANNVIEIHGGAISSLTPGNVKVTNNRISACGYYGRHSVIASGTDSTAAPSDYGNEISNNLIQDCMTFMGIVCNANDTKILYNEIVNPGYYIGDGGAIYMGKSNVKYGMEVAYNYIHDGHKGDSNYAYCGLYSDDGYSGNNYHHNVVRDMYQGMIVGVGMNAKFNNNLFIKNSLQPHILSRMTDYKASSGAVESGYQSMMYNEANLIKEKAVYKDVFFEKYPLIAQALARKPYFAPWNTEVTGNILIGEKGGISRPWHPYYTKDGDTVIENEDVLIAENEAALKNGSKYIGSTLFKGYYVDELLLYGAKITDNNNNDLNATKVGNPIYDYDENLFVNVADGDYSLRSELSKDVSTAYEIDMSKIGPKTVEGTEGLVEAIYPLDGAKCESEMLLGWNKVRNASYYVVTVSVNEDLSEPVTELAIREASLDLAAKVSLNPSTKYYWNIKAVGLAKDDTFEITSKTYSFTTVSQEERITDGFDYVLSMLDSQLAKCENGEIEYTNEEAYPNLKELSMQAHDIREKGALTDEINEISDSILKALDLYDDYVVSLSAEIVECKAERESDNINVKAKGFEANSLVSITVTNPLYDLNSVSNLFNLDGVQYTDTVKSDEQGNVEFTFNTRVKNEDRSGIYTVYMSGENGKVVNKTYCYGIISAGDITYTNAQGEVITDLAEYNGQIVTMSCNIWNGTKTVFRPVIVNAFYNGNCVLSDVQTADMFEIEPETSEEIKWEVQINQADTAKVLFLHSLATLRPFEKCRVIYETAKGKVN